MVFISGGDYSLLPFLWTHTCHFAFIQSIPEILNLPNRNKADGGQSADFFLHCLCKNTQHNSIFLSRILAKSKPISWSNLWSSNLPNSVYTWPILFVTMRYKIKGVVKTKENGKTSFQISSWAIKFYTSSFLVWHNLPAVAISGLQQCDTFLHARPMLYMHLS
jgi:hypothetical protein